MASNTPPFSYQWQFAGNNLPGATNSSLIVSNLQNGINTGAYKVTVTNIAGSIDSATATLAIARAAGEQLRFLRRCGWSDRLLAAR